MKNKPGHTSAAMHMRSDPHMMLSMPDVTNLVQQAIDGAIRS